MTIPINLITSGSTMTVSSSAALSSSLVVKTSNVDIGSDNGLIFRTGNADASVGKKFSLAHTDGTKYLEIQQTSAGNCHIGGGPAGAETHVLEIRSTYVNIESHVGHVSVASVGDLYLGHGAGASIAYLREAGVVAGTLKLDVDGPSYMDFVDTVTVVELRKNASKRVSFAAATTNLWGTNVVVGGETGTGGTAETTGIGVFNAGSGLYIQAPNVFNRNFAQTLCLTHTFSPTGINSVDCVSAATYELQHNTSPRVAIDSTSVTLSGDVVYRENAAGTAYSQIRTSSALLATSSTTYVDTYVTTANRVYRVKAESIVSNDTDNRGVVQWKFAAFKNVAGVVTAISASGGGLVVSPGAAGADAANFEDAGQGGTNTTINFSGTSIRVGVANPSTGSLNANIITEISERVLV